MDHFNKNWGFQEIHLPEVKRIILQSLPLICSIREATLEEDTRRSTDIVLVLDKVREIAVRLRRESAYQDWTIRASLPSGKKTELEKLKEGFASLYFYGWTKAGKVRRYAIIDLDKARPLLARDWQARTAPSGETFIYIPIREVYKAGALITGRLFDGEKQLKDF